MTRVNRHTLASQVEEALRADIIGGVLPPGVRLRRSDLGGKYAVSATPLREAMQRLAAEGLIDINPHTGAAVTAISREDLDDTYWVRGMLEVMAVQRSIERGDTAWAASVEDAYGVFRDATVAMQTDAAADRLVAQTRAHRAFHDSLTEACGSRWLSKTLKTLNDHAERYRMLNVTSGMGDALDDHAALGAAAVSRHPHVVELLWSHRSAYLDALKQRLDDEESTTQVA
jgi:DNA-binding GntR family transcriptional regulator